MYNQFPDNGWFLYDDTSGNIRLKHRYRPDMQVNCPYCDKPFIIKSYRMQCCDNIFKTGFGEICQVKPVGTHNKVKGRGWQSLRAAAGNKVVKG